MSFCLWITGLPGSGKSTIARELETLLGERGVPVLTLAMDNLRTFLTPHPKYTDEEREGVYRALVLVARLILKHSPKSVIIDATGNRKRFRTLAREHLADFAEVYVNCPVEVCRAREQSRKKGEVEEGLYEKAEKGQLEGGLPGVSAPYEPPTEAEVEVRSDAITAKEAAEEIMEYVRNRWVNEKDAA
jgi:adenylylsulfate kinase